MEEMFFENRILKENILKIRDIQVKQKMLNLKKQTNEFVDKPKNQAYDATYAKA